MPNAVNDINDFEARLRIVERQLDRLEAHLQSELGNISRLLTAINEDVRKTITILHDDARPGVVTRLDRIEQLEIHRANLLLRLDRLEQIENARSWQIRAIVGTTAAILLERIANLLFKI